MNADKQMRLIAGTLHLLDQIDWIEFIGVPDSREPATAAFRSGATKVLIRSVCIELLSDPPEVPDETECDFAVQVIQMAIERIIGGDAAHLAFERGVSLEPVVKFTPFPSPAVAGLNVPKIHRLEEQ